jgi:hypothetical protein
LNQWGFSPVIFNVAGAIHLGGNFLLQTCFMKVIEPFVVFLYLVSRVESILVNAPQYCIILDHLVNDLPLRRGTKCVVDHQIGLLV